MTPAEKPRDVERKVLLVRLEKKARALPIPVDSPANAVRVNANNTFSFMIARPNLAPERGCQGNG